MAPWLPQWEIATVYSVAFIINDLWFAFMVWYYGPRILGHSETWSRVVALGILPDIIFHVSGEEIFALQYTLTPVLIETFYICPKGIWEAWGWKGLPIIIISALGSVASTWYPTDDGRLLGTPQPARPNPDDTPFFYVLHFCGHASLSLIFLTFWFIKYRESTTKKMTGKGKRA